MVLDWQCLGALDDISWANVETVPWAHWNTVSVQYSSSSSRLARQCQHCVVLFLVSPTCRLISQIETRTSKILWIFHLCSCGGQCVFGLADVLLMYRCTFISNTYSFDIESSIILTNVCFYVRKCVGTISYVTQHNVVYRQLVLHTSCTIIWCSQICPDFPGWWCCKFRGIVLADKVWQRYSIWSNNHFQITLQLNYTAIPLRCRL